jgi:hypothetical protein
MAYSSFRDRIENAAAQAPAIERAEFIKKTYLHLSGAVVATVALTALLVNLFGASLTETMVGSSFSWLFVLGAFMLVTTVAERWSRRATSPAMQYAGLGLYVVAESVIFTPLLTIAAVYAPGSVGTAGIITLAIFGGLTGTVLFTKQDFSFLGRFLTLAGFAAFGLIVASLLFGFSLGGTLFSGAMILLMSGYILYNTSNVLHRYPVGSHVAASLALYASVATLFWYVLRFVMSDRS